MTSYYGVQVRGGRAVLRRAAPAVDLSQPELPRVYIDTSAVPAITGATWTPTDAAGFQAALDGAALGDCISLDKTLTYTGNFALPNKTSGSGWITIRSSASASLPAIGTRVGPADATNMPTIRSANSSPALQTATAAHHYWLQGLEITVSSGVATIFHLVGFGGTQATDVDTPHDLTVDRCYVHGQTTGDVFRCVLLNGARVAVVDSYISDGHAAGFDAQALFGYNGPGPFKIVNNYLAGAGENVLFGGADPVIANLVPSDIEIRLNTVVKPLAWKTDDPAWNGSTWTIKNLLELKNARRVLIDANTFTNCWTGEQDGVALVITPRNQDNSAPWSATQDITITHNRISNAQRGVNIAGTDSDGHLSQQTQRVLIQHNLFLGTLDGFLFQIVSGADALTLSHNTGFSAQKFIGASGEASTRVVFTDNIVGYGLYGVIGDGQAPGQGSITAYFPGMTFTKNLLVGDLDGASYPGVTFVEATKATVGFVDWPTENYRLTGGSAYHLVGTDGLDLGCNLDALPGG